MDADAGAPAVLASRLFTAMDADAGAPAVLASRLLTAVDADADAPAVLASRLLTAVDALASARSPCSSTFPAANAGACSATSLASRPVCFLREDKLSTVYHDFLAFCVPKVVRLRRFLIRADWSEAALARLTRRSGGYVSSSICPWVYAGENIFSSSPSKSFPRCTSTDGCGR